jgi:hypothetical protein
MGISFSIEGGTCGIPRKGIIAPVTVTGMIVGARVGAFDFKVAQMPPVHVIFEPGSIVRRRRR